LTYGESGVVDQIKEIAFVCNVAGVERRLIPWRGKGEVGVCPVLVATSFITRIISIEQDCLADYSRCGDLVDETLVEVEQVLVVQNERYSRDFSLDRGAFANARVVNQSA